MTPVFVPRINADDADQVADPRNLLDDDECHVVYGETKTV